MHRTVYVGSSVEPKPRADADSSRSSWVVPLALWAGVCLAGVLGAVAVVQKMLSSPNVLTNYSPAKAFEPLLSGRDLHVTSEPGLWLTEKDGTQVLVQRSAESGSPQRVLLCGDQVVQGGLKPGLLYPITLAPSLAALGQRSRAAEVARNPLLVAPVDGQGMPELLVSGVAGSNQPDSTALVNTQLVLQVRPQATAAVEGTDWAMAMTDKLARGSAAHDFKLSGTQSQSTAWLLWSPVASSVPFERGLERGFQRGVRLRLMADASCAAGALEWQLFAPAHGQTVALLPPLATVSVRGTAITGQTKPRTDLRTVTATLPPGRYPVAAAPGPSVEDEALFNRARNAGLLAVQPGGRIAVAPLDLRRATPAEASAWPALAGGMAPNALDTLSALHTTANGSYIKQQVQTLNDTEHWLAWRWKLDGGVAPVVNASAGGELLRLANSMPDVTVRLFAALPTGWTGWQRAMAPIKAADAEATVRLRIELTPALRELAERNNGLEMLLLGQLQPAITGARVQANSVCDGSGCVDRAVLNQLRLMPDAGASEIVINVKPEPRYLKLKPARTGALVLQWASAAAQGAAGASRTVADLRWVSPRPASLAVVTDFKPREGAVDLDAADAIDALIKFNANDIQVRARDGAVLYADGSPTAAARTMGLTSLVGFSNNHTGSLVGLMQRAAVATTESGQLPINSAQVTIDPLLQALSQEVLGCLVHVGGRWNATARHCDRAVDKKKVDAPAQSAASLVWMDAMTGEILAAANGQTEDLRALPAEALAFHRFNPGASTLTLNAWQHDGKAHHAAGSTFKIVSALALEKTAAAKPAAAAELGGLTILQADAMARSAGLEFRMNAGCYPAPCSGKQAEITNYPANRPPSPAQYASEGRFGVVQALRKSVNTWFAFMAEAKDELAKAGRVGVLPLGADALASERPLLAMARQLGFEKKLTLDGGLLPGVVWQGSDALAVSPSRLDSITRVHELRQAGIGLRMQATPLQMASVAGAVATGLVVTPRLLTSLGTQPATSQSVALGLKLDRVKQGMKEVVDSGTAAGAFGASPALKQKSQHIYGKTGTAPIQNSDLNTVWFVGYVEGGAIAGHPNPLAFAVKVTHTQGTGGAVAAPVVASILDTLWQARVQ